MTRPPLLFDVQRRARARARAAKTFADHDFLHRRVMLDIVDRLETVTRRFGDAVVYGASGLTGLLTPACSVGRLVCADLARSRLPGGGIAFDEDFNPFTDGTLDLAVSVLTLHAVNDPVGAITQWRKALRPDGLFIAAIFAEDTLSTWRAALYAAEAAQKGGVAPRVHPFAAVQDLGAALQRAGFALPVVDIDHVDITYQDAGRLLADLKGMGETGALANAPPPAGRGLLADALARLDRAGGKVRFDIAYLTGWAPHPSQPKPLKPGSATQGLEAAVKAAKPD